MPFSVTKIAASSAAQTVLQRRAIQCSFSSVFHVRNANGGAASEESKIAEKIFTRAVVWPMCAMVFVGGMCVVKKQFNDGYEKRSVEQ
mmetsp:Transcript_3309/g.6867  ORF Transcript_3309/g.6867 Transcript_3309/m.6867 type:complete len:88 (-) Transcript_3309:558-821(-)